MVEQFAEHDVLLLVDVQVDFCPGGRLAVANGDQVVPVLNRWIDAAVKSGIQVYASRDWHPRKHVSFRQQGGPWPLHCLQDSEGAGFHPDLALPETAIKITKGVRFDRDQNSVFDETGFAEQLRRDGIRRLWVGGLALDVCVRATVLDGRKAGFEINLIRDGCRGIDADGSARALDEMEKAGAKIVT